MKSGIKCVVIGILSASLGAGAMAIYKDIDYVLLENDAVEEKFVKKLTMINEQLSKRYIYDVDKEKVFNSAIKGYVWGLEEDYTNYYTKEDFETFTSSVEETYVGIGVVVAPNEEGFIEIISAFEDSSAYNAGVKPGDILYKVNGEEYYAEEMDKAIAQIKNGKEGESVNLSVLRKGEEIEINVKREVVSMSSVKSKMYSNDIGYVRISAFNTEGDSSKTDTYSEFCENVESLREQGAKKLIIDLRDNPGGTLDVVVDIADYLLPEGLITYVEYKDGTKQEYKSDKKAIDMPMVVLINENSASASEVLTGALKDHKKATIVGTTSFGKGVVQSIIPFSDGSGMTMTIAKYYSPNGVCIHGTGIEPDVVVELDEKYDGYYASELPQEDDLQMMKAVELLK